MRKEGEEAVLEMSECVTGLDTLKSSHSGEQREITERLFS